MITVVEGMEIKVFIYISRQRRARGKNNKDAASNCCNLTISKEKSGRARTDTKGTYAASFCMATRSNISQHTSRQHNTSGRRA